MKTLIICNSKTGFTKQYADWISEEVGGTVIPYKSAGSIEIGAEDTVIFGSRVYAGKIEYLSKMKTRLRAHRRFVVFATGGMPGDAPNTLEKLWESNLTAEERGRIPYFYMQGGLRYERMGFIDRTVMKTVAKLMKRQAAEGEEFARHIQSSYDISSREYIKPLVDHVKSGSHLG